MSRHRQDAHTDDLDPAVAQELRALEAALAGAPSADPELLALVEAVRVDAPPPRADFRRELDARIATAFTAGGGPRALLTGLRTRAAGRRRFTLAPALGLAAAAVIALVVGIGVLHDAGSGSGGDLSTSSVQMSEQASPKATAGSAAAQDSAAAPQAPTAAPEAARQSGAGTMTVEPSPPSTGATSTATPPFGRKVEQTTRLSLRTSARKLQEVSDGIVRVTQAAGGVVQQSDVEATDRGGTAAFTLTVPSAKAQETVRRLSALAHVASMSQSATDITASFVSVADRLSDARAERRALLRALAAAKTPEGIARLRERIRVNRTEVASLKGRLNGLRHRADTTVLSVALTAQGGATPSGRQGAGSDTWTPGDAARDALRVLEVAFGALLVGLAVALPLGLVVLPATFGARAARRRRREHALDPA